MLGRDTKLRQLSYSSVQTKDGSSHSLNKANGVSGPRQPGSEGTAVIHKAVYKRGITLNKCLCSINTCERFTVADSPLCECFNCSLLTMLTRLLRALIKCAVLDGDVSVGRN